MIDRTAHTSAVSASLTGLVRSREQFNAAAVNVVNSYAAASNAASAANNGDKISVETAAAVKDTHPAEAVVSMMSAEHSYRANLKALEKEHEMHRELLKTHRKVDIKA